MCCVLPGWRSVETVCEHEDGVEEHIPVTWFLLWEEDGWRLLERIPEGPPP